MEGEKIKNIIKTIAIIGIIGIIIYLYISNEKDTSNDYVSMTKTEKIEYENSELKDENRKYEDEISHLNSRIDELEKELEYTEEYIDILKEQLESYGIEPEEL